jgi:hypothetical protein
MTEIKIIFLLAYDFELVKLSLPCVYNHADKILFSIDINRTSFAGNKYYFDENFINWIKEYDTESKITIYEDNFYQSNLTVMECETRQRQMSADYLGEGGWTIQLDVDEYFINFKSFVTFLETKSNYLIDPKKLEKLDTMPNESNQGTIVYQLKRKNEQLEETMNERKKTLPEQVISVLKDYLKNLENTDVMSKMFDINEETNILRAMLNLNLNNN